jgi:hypothetical protein
MAPPQLARDAPVLDVFQPLVVGGRPVFRHELDLAAAHDVERVSVIDLPGLNVPSGAGFVMATNHWSVSIGSITTPVRSPRGTISLCGFTDSRKPCVEIGDDRFARVEAVEAAILLGGVVVDLRVEREDLDRREVVAQADLVVVEVVRGRDLDDAGAEFAVDVVVGDDRISRSVSGSVTILPIRCA